MTIAYYTKKGETTYAILNRFPFGARVLEHVPYHPDLQAKLLSVDAPITIRNHDGKAELLFPAIDPEDVKCQWLYAVEIRNQR